MSYLKELLLYMAYALSICSINAQTDSISDLLDNAYKFETTNPDTAIQIYKHTVQLAIAEGDDLNRGRATSYIALVHMASGRYDSLKHYNNEALKIFEEIEYQKGIASIYNNQANAYLYQGFYVQALEAYHKALPYFEQEGQEFQLTVILNNIASLFQHNEDVDQSLSYLQRSLDISKNIKDPHAIGNTFNNISAGYLSMNKLDQAYVFADSAVNYINQTDDTSTQIKIEGNLARIAASVGETEKAKQILSSLQEKKNSIQDIELDIVVSSTNAHVYQSIKNHEEAIYYGKESLKKLQIFNDKNYEIDVIKVLQKEHEEIGKFETALYYAKRLDTVKAESFLSTKNQQTSELEALFQNRKNTEQLILQKIEIEKRKAQRNMLGGLAATLTILFISGIYFFLNRRKRNAEQILLKQSKINQLEQRQKLLALDYMMQGQEEERKRIAQDLHDGLGSLLTSVRHKVISISEQVDELSNINIVEDTEKMISEACEEVRRISHDMMPASLVSLGFRDAIEDLSEDLKSKSALQIDLNITGDFDDLTDKVKINIYRVVQEACNNTIRHAQATALNISLHRSQQTLSGTILDNGIGIHPNQLNESEGIGLKNIKSRIGYLGGEVSINSTKGVEVKFSIKI